MSGRYSRNRGMRGEYIVRNYFRQLGYSAERVPLSGASAAMKGDVVFSKDGKTYFAEVKIRKNDFGSIYALYDDQVRILKDDLVAFCTEPGSTQICVQMSTSFDGVMTKADYYPLMVAHPMYEKHGRAMKKVSRMQEWVKGCDVLVIKNDHKGLLFLRYL